MENLLLGQLASGPHEETVLMLTTIVALALAATPQPAERTPEEVVAIHEQAMNTGDLDAYMGTFAPDAALYYYRDRQTPIVKGRDALRARSKAIMENGGRAIVVSEMVLPDGHVIEREITYRVGKARFFDTVVIYTIEKGLIVRMDFIGGEEPVWLVKAPEAQ